MSVIGRFFLFVLLLFTTLLFGQEFKLLQGKIVHPELSVAQIHIINLSRGNAEVTDVDGAFEISVRKGERLRFSGVQFKPLEIEISAAVFTTAELTVYLEAQINELEEVVVKPHALSGSLSQDLQNVKAPINFSDVGIPGFKGKRKERIVSSEEILLRTLLLPISGGVDIEAIYKHLSGYYKSLKKKRALEANFLAVYKMIRFYGVVYFIDTFGFKTEEVYDFVLACSENTSVIDDFNKGRHDRVLKHFETYNSIYRSNE